MSGLGQGQGSGPCGVRDEEQFRILTTCIPLKPYAHAPFLRSLVPRASARGRDGALLHDCATSASVIGRVLVPLV